MAEAFAVKKLLAVLALSGVLVLAGLVAGGWSAGWFGEKDAPVPPGAAGPEQQDRLRAEARERAARLSKLNGSELEAALEKWAAGSGRDRNVSWLAVAVAGGADRDRITRIRACRLAQALAGRARGAVGDKGLVDANGVEPLLRCLASPDPGLVSAAVAALGTMHLKAPDLELDRRLKPLLSRRLGDEDVAVVKAAMSALPMLADLSLVPEFISAWERHASDTALAASAAGHMRVLAELHIRGEITATRPGIKKAEAVTESRRRAASAAGEMGRDPAKWRAWWNSRTKRLPAETDDPDSR